MTALELTTRDTILDRFRERIALGKRTKLSSEEFEALIADFIQRLTKVHTPEEIQQLCTTEIELLEEGYKQATLASDYIPKYRKAIEEAIADGTLPTSPDTTHDFTHEQRVTGIQDPRSEHWALTFFKYDKQIYEDLDLRQAQLNRSKLLNLQAVNPKPYLEMLEELLNSTDRFQDRHMAVAIAGLTGRRLGEVLARGSFGLTSHPYLLHFEGQQKSDRSGYDIITLIPAPTLLLKIEEFRDLPEIKGLMRLQGEALTQAINKFDVQINRECDKYLSRDGLVPPLENRKRVTVHNLRSLWGAIAAWMFCPPHQHEYAFIQHYLGHVLESSATGHYFRYRLVDETGKTRQEQGTMLNQIPELPLIEDIEEVIEEPMDKVGDAISEEPVVETGDAIKEEPVGEVGDAIKEAPVVEVVEDKPKRKSRKSRKAKVVEPQGTGVEVDQAALKDEVVGLFGQIQEELRTEWAEQLLALRQEMLEQIAASKPKQSKGSLWLAERVSALESGESGFGGWEQGDRSGTGCAQVGVGAEP